MKIKAKISCRYEDDSTAEAIESAISPDNLDSPDHITVGTRRKENTVESEVEIEGEIETLIATLDDLLACTSTAEKMI